jgi:hypothetical protein
MPSAASAWGGVADARSTERSAERSAERIAERSGDEPTGHPCSVCGEPCSTASSRLSPCGHLACEACVTQLRRAATMTAERGVRCPAPGCQHYIQNYLEPTQQPPKEGSARATSAGSAGRGGRGAAKEGREAPVAKGSVLRGGRVGTPRRGSEPAMVTAPAKATPSLGRAAGVPLELADAEKNSEPW